jgi:hypothetical protein
MLDASFCCAIIYKVQKQTKSPVFCRPGLLSICFKVIFCYSLSIQAPAASAKKEEVIKTGVCYIFFHAVQKYNVRLYRQIFFMKCMKMLADVQITRYIIKDFKK